MSAQIRHCGFEQAEEQRPYKRATAPIPKRSLSRLWPSTIERRYAQVESNQSKTPGFALECHRAEARSHEARCAGSSKSELRASAPRTDCVFVKSLCVWDGRG